MEFVLFKKLAELEGVELITLAAAAAVALALLVYLVISRGRGEAAVAVPAARNSTRLMVEGGLAVSMSFVLSYIKLFSMPFGGSITLLSMLPITMYAAIAGPARGFTAAFAYSLLQLIQGPYVVHPVQFVLDYFVAFTCFGLASFFPANLAAGVGVAGLARLAASTVSGAVFFGEYAAEAGFSNAWVYSLVYNLSTIGVDTLLCVIVALLPTVKRLAAKLRAT